MAKLWRVIGLIGFSEGTKAFVVADVPEFQNQNGLAVFCASDIFSARMIHDPWRNPSWMPPVPSAVADSSGGIYPRLRIYRCSPIRAVGSKGITCVEVSSTESYWLDEAMKLAYGQTIEFHPSTKEVLYIDGKKVQPKEGS